MGKGLLCTGKGIRPAILRGPDGMDPVPVCLIAVSAAYPKSRRSRDLPDIVSSCVQGYLVGISGRVGLQGSRPVPVLKRLLPGTVAAVDRPGQGIAGMILRQFRLS